MAVQVGSLFASLTLESGGFNRGLVQAERSTTKAMGNIQRQAGLTSRSVDGINRSFSQPIRPYSLIAVSRAFDNTADRANLLRGSLIATTAVFGGFAAALTSNVILRYADTYTQLNNQLRVVSTSSADLRAQFGALEDVATRSRSGLKETVILYSRLAKAAPNLKPDSVLKYTETIQKALQLGGATAQEASSAAIQFSQAIASNRLGGEELRAILETPLGLALAKGLGVTIGKFREMSIAGKLTADVVLGALEKIGPSVDKQFEGSVKTLDQAITYADNKFTSYVGTVNEAYGITGLLGSAVTGLADNLEGIGRVLGYVIPLVSGLFAAKLVGNISGRLGAGIGNAIRDFQNVERVAQKASRGVGGAWRELRASTQATFEDASKQVSAFQRQLDEAVANRNDLKTKIAGGGRGAFADRDVLKNVARESAALEKLETRRLEIQQQIRDSYRKLSTTTAQVTPKILSATKAVSDAESKLNGLLTQQTALRKAQRDNAQRQVTAGVGALQRPGPTKSALAEVRAAAREEIRLAREVEAAQTQVLRTREALTQRFSNLSASEAAAQTAAANQRIASLNQLNALSEKNAQNEVQRAQVRQRLFVGEIARDRQSVANANRELANSSGAINSLQNSLYGATRAQNIARASLGGLARAATVAGGVFSSLFRFLGGPWGVALTAASVAFTAFGINSARTAQQVADSQNAIDEALGRLAEKGDEAAIRSIEQGRIDEAVKGTTKSLNDATSAWEEYEDRIVGVSNVMDAMRDVDRQAELFPGTAFEDASDFIKTLLKDVKEGRIGLEEFNTALSNFGSRNNISPDLIENIREITSERNFIDSAKAIEDWTLKLQMAKGAVAGNSRADIAGPIETAMGREFEARIATDRESFIQLLAAVNTEEKKMAASIEETIKSTGQRVSAATKEYIKNQSAMINRLDDLAATAQAPAVERPKVDQGNVRRVGGVDPNTRSVVDPYALAKQADTLANLQKMRGEIVEIKNQIVTAQAVISGQLPLIEQAFGTKEQTDRVKAAITDARALVQNLSAAFSSGKVSPVEVFNQLEGLRAMLKAAGAETDAIELVVKAVGDAITSLPKLGAQLDSSTTGFKELAKAQNEYYLGSSLVKRVPGPSTTPIIPGPTITGAQLNKPPEVSQAEQVLAKAKADLDGIVSQVTSLPQNALTQSMFGNDPVAFQTALTESQARIGEVVQKIMDGRIPANDLGTALAWIKNGLVESGAQSGALDPFMKALAESLGRIDPMISKINQLTGAMKNLAAATRDVKLAGSGNGSSDGSTGYGPAKTNPLPEFASGGAFKVGGGGGTDSQLVQFMASPTETVAVFTPSQLKTFNGSLSGGGTSVSVQAPVTIVTSDANSFKASRRQVQMDIADAVSAAVNRTRQ